MIKPNPFTPQSGWEPRVFGGREEEIALFKKGLASAVDEKAQHLVALGQWGIGKTSLLRFFRKLAQEEGYPAALCPIGKFAKGERVGNGINLLIEELERNFPTAKAKRSGAKGHLQPQTALTNKLAEIWQGRNGKPIVVLLDDVQNFLAVSGVVDILRLVLSRDEILNDTKYLFVLSCTPEAWQAFLDKHDPVGRFFKARILLSKLNEPQAKKIISTTLTGSGVDFSGEIIEKICQYSQGHPYELQLLSANLYEAQIEGNVAARCWDGALEKTLRDLGREYFETLYRQVTDREAVPLRILAQLNRPVLLKELEDALWLKIKEFRGYPIRDTKNYIYRLLEKDIVRKTGRGEYEIFDRMFGEYFLRR